MNYSTRNMQNINDQMLDLFEESSGCELDDVFFGKDETYGAAADIPTTREMKQIEDEHSVYSSSTQTSDLFDDCDEEFDLNPLPCNGSEQLVLADYRSSEGFSILLFQQDNRRPRTVSPGSDSTGSSETPQYMMTKLAECMERSALSRSLVEIFGQSSLLQASASQENIQASSSMAMKKSGGRIQDNKIAVVKASASCSAKKHSSIGLFLRNKCKNQKPSDSVSSPSKENDDFRASGLRLCTQALIAKSDFLGSANRDDGNHRIISFLRREKLK
jgi:hypothetical protein